MQSEDQLSPDLGDKHRQVEQGARHEAELLRSVLDLLPVAVTVQNEAGDFVLVNNAAALNSRMRGDAADSDAPLGRRHPQESAQSNAHEPEALATDKLVTVEEAVVGPAGERKLLTSRKPVRILHEAFVLSTSLDITERKRIESELTRRAYYDELTGLPKANLIQERIDNLISQQGDDNRFALVLIDIDNFSFRQPRVASTVAMTSGS